MVFIVCSQIADGQGRDNCLVVKGQKQLLMAETEALGASVGLRSTLHGPGLGSFGAVPSGWVLLVC